jgi:integrase/recombinase XerD
MLLFTHLCGLRVGEVAALRFDDILDANGNIRDEMTLDAARTKSKRARKIFLPKQMQRQLREYVNSLNKQPLHGYLFSTQKQAHFSANTATQHLQRTWLTALSQRGVSVFVLADMAGHRSIQTTQRYVTVNDEMKRNAAELIS